MDPERFELVVTEAEGCSVVKAGDRWLFHGHEVKARKGARLCVAALHFLYPQLEQLRQEARAGRLEPREPLRCHSWNCRVSFRTEMVRGTAGPPGTARVTRRLAHEAVVASEDGTRGEVFMSRLPPQLATQLIGACAKARYEPGQEILAEGVRGEHLFIVGSGEVEVVRRSAGGQAETVLAVLPVGECFGEMSLLGGRPTTAAVRARGAVAVFSVDRAQLETILAATPELNRIFSQLLADRLSAMTQTLESELERGMRGKLSALSFIELVQTLHTSRRSGTLILLGQQGEGRVGFRNGKVASAVLGAHAGNEAFYALAGWPDGEFSFEPDLAEVPEAARIKEETVGLLMESLRRLDETQRGRG